MKLKKFCRKIRLTLKKRSLYTTQNNVQSTHRMKIVVIDF